MASADEEQSMDIGTQSQSQMDTDTQKTVTEEEGPIRNNVAGGGDGAPVQASGSGEKETESNVNGVGAAAKEAEPVLDVGVADEEEEEEDDEEYKFPKTLDGFKYAFNENGQMRNTETGEPFEFKVKSNEDEEYNQKRYEALGEVITQYVYDLLESEVKLKKVYIPVDKREDEPQSFIFMTEDALTNPDKLMLLIHGTGVVRAGQWARRLIINDCLDSGTQIPFIKRSVEEGYGVIVLNTNENSVSRNGKVIPIRENSFPEEHTFYVWETFVCKAAAKHVAILAHSYGGVVTVELMIQKENEIKERVFAIALTDSVHSLVHQEASRSVSRYFKQVAKNWISSKDHLDTPQESRNKYECSRVSAGTPKHEQTSWNSFESIFTYFTEKYTDVLERDKKEEL